MREYTIKLKSDEALESLRDSLHDYIAEDVEIVDVVEVYEPRNGDVVKASVNEDPDVWFRSGSDWYFSHWKSSETDQTIKDGVKSGDLVLVFRDGKAV